MTPFQKAALSQSCLMGFEVLNPALRRTTRAGSVVLSVNRGYE